MAQRGPLPPDSLAACILYDFERAVKRLDVFEQAVIALTAFGFSTDEIASVIDPDGVIPLDRRELRHKLVDRRKRIARALYGRPKRDAEGRTVKDEEDNVVHVGGLIPKLVRLMNGGG